MIAAARQVCNATRHSCDGSSLILRHRVQGSVKAVRAIRNTRVFLTETRIVADVASAIYPCRLSNGYPMPSQVSNCMLGAHRHALIQHVLFARLAGSHSSPRRIRQKLDFFSSFTPL